MIIFNARQLLLQKTHRRFWKYFFTYDFKSLKTNVFGNKYRFSIFHRYNSFEYSTVLNTAYVFNFSFWSGILFGGFRYMKSNFGHLYLAGYRLVIIKYLKFVWAEYSGPTFCGVPLVVPPWHHPTPRQNSNYLYIVITHKQLVQNLIITSGNINSALE